MYKPCLSIVSPSVIQDDEANDPQWSMEQILATQFRCGGVLIGAVEAGIMARMTVTIFEILEKSWASVDCSLIDMKIEFGIDVATGECREQFGLCM